MRSVEKGARYFQFSTHTEQNISFIFCFALKSERII